jgi:hypothetical protein
MANRIEKAVGAALLATTIGGVAFGAYKLGEDGSPKPAAVVAQSEGGMPSSSPFNGVDVQVTPGPVMSEAPVASQEAQLSYINPASKDANGNWIINTPDAEAKTVQGIEGFTPDANLVLAPEWGKALGLNPEKFADFQPSLNNPEHPLVGYTYGENDQSDNIDYRRTLQGPMYSWTVLTGEEVEVPGIGHLKSNPGGAVEVMIMNITDTVIGFNSENPVMIRHGFTGTGRIWDGGNVVEAEGGISSHYVSRLENGVTLPGESGFIGQCDEVDNCSDIKVVSVIYRQWGNNEDGTPRYQFQLLRQEQVTK